MHLLSTTGKEKEPMIRICMLTSGLWLEGLTNKFINIVLFSSNQNVQVLLETWLEILPFHLPLCNHSCLRFSHQSHSRTEISHPEVHVEECVRG